MQIFIKLFDECNNNLYLVIKWRKRHKLSASALKGEKVVDDVIVFSKNQFFLDELCPVFSRQCLLRCQV